MQRSHQLTKFSERKILPFFLIVLIGAAVWFYPHSKEIQDRAWHLFAIFITAIFAIILKPLPIGAIAILALGAATATQTLTLEESLSSFNNDIVWLVLLAFFIARGFIKTGLANRIAYGFITIFGKSTIGLSYGMLISEVVLAPAIPSVTARTGGILFPILQGLAQSFGSDPKLGTEGRMGSYLLKVAYQGSIISSAMFLTAMAANPMIAGFTQQAGFTLNWGTWAVAAIVPGLISLFALPLIVFYFYPPEIKKTPQAPQFAKEKLKEMGSLKNTEWLMLFIFLFLLIFWILGPLMNLKATTVALFGLGLLLFCKVLTWSDVTKEENAWDTFIWFATLVTLATFLNKFGFISWVSEQILETAGGYHWVTALSVIALVYMYSHYLFASSTAHVCAMYPAFLLVSIGIGAPPFLAILLLAFFSNLCGGLTHYGSGPAPIFYGSGYINVLSWWKIGGIVSIFNILIWGLLGTMWWKFLGLW